jgi:large subunit ribosomal protein L31e
MVEKKNIDKIEREYTIPLRNKVMKVPAYKRAKKAIRVIREFLVKNMRIRDRDLGKIKLDKYLNQMIWSRGIKHPPHKIRIKAIKEGEIVRVEAYELSENLKFNKKRAETSAKKELDKKENKKKKENKEVDEKESEEKNESKNLISPKQSQSEEEIVEKKKNTIEAEQKYEKQKAKERKHEANINKKPIKNKKEHSKGMGSH